MNYDEFKQYAFKILELVNRFDINPESLTNSEKNFLINALLVIIKSDTDE